MGGARYYYLYSIKQRFMSMTSHHKVKYFQNWKCSQRSLTLICAWYVAVFHKSWSVTFVLWWVLLGISYCMWQFILFPDIYSYIKVLPFISQTSGFDNDPNYKGITYLLKYHPAWGHSSIESLHPWVSRFSDWGYENKMIYRDLRKIVQLLK